MKLCIFTCLQVVGYMRVYKMVGWTDKWGGFFFKYVHLLTRSCPFVWVAWSKYDEKGAATSTGNPYATSRVKAWRRHSKCFNNFPESILFFGCSLLQNQTVGDLVTESGLNCLNPSYKYSRFFSIRDHEIMGDDAKANCQASHTFQQHLQLLENLCWQRRS